MGAARATKMVVRVRCAAPVIVLPVSGRSRGALVAELAHLHIDNCFKLAGDPGTASTMTDPASGECGQEVHGALEIAIRALERDMCK